MSSADRVAAQTSALRAVFGAVLTLRTTLTARIATTTPGDGSTGILATSMGSTFVPMNTPRPSKREWRWHRACGCV